MTPTIQDAARAIAARTLSPVELTQRMLARIRAQDGTLHAFTEITQARALSDAHAAEVWAMAGTLRGPLDGIPIAHKDIFATAGIATTGCSRQLAGWLPRGDAAAVAGLAAAGAVILGKLTCYEHALAGPDPDLPWPPARNPWNTERSTPGSSSGTAAAVAAGLVLGGAGSDTGGSARDPAAVCGCVGMKPTYGLCSRTGALPFAPSLDHPGVLARSAWDCALLLQAIAGHDPADPTTRTQPAPSFTEDIEGGVRGLRIGLVRRFHEEEAPASPATRRAVDEAVQVFRGLGAEVRKASLPALADFEACGWVIALSELRAAHEGSLALDGGARFGGPLREGLALGGLLSAADYVQAVRQRGALCGATATAMAGLDLLLLATQPDKAPMSEAEGSLPFQKPNYTMPFNVRGQPAISLPAGFGAGGLPVAVQLVARP